MTDIRIYGKTLEETDTFIDCAVSEITLDETVHLDEIDGTRTWTLPLATVQSLIDKRKAATHENITHPNHDVWDRLDGLNGDVKTEPFTSTDIDLDTKIEEIFVTTMEIVTDDSNNGITE